ncbi:hypothetical protein GW17_00055531 [Ensete ventricosum]|nr:hypothetical protein GW17_00055531 [Ensete ventricosum]RZS23429.1 hypothetical protein BHM03_00056367 [Ensete ventricosum]
MSVAPAKGGDLEAAGGSAAPAPAPLYPKMTEDPKLRWAFIRKVYAILAAQFLLTAGVASVISFVRPIPAFLLSHTPASLAVFFALLLLPLIGNLCFPLSRFAHTIYGCAASLVFSGFLIYDTDKLIKRHTYNEYVIAAISLYMDIINLFISMLGLAGATALD